MGRDQVFLSYAREDEARAQILVRALEREGISVWWDHDIAPGKSWDEVIGARIESARAVIVLWSAKSVRSNFVKEEAQLALDGQKLVPVLIEKVDPPIGFRRMHAANLIGWAGEADHRQWRALLEALHTHLGIESAAAGARAAGASAPAYARSSGSAGISQGAGSSASAPSSRTMLFAIAALAALGLVLWLGLGQGEGGNRKAEAPAPASSSELTPARTEASAPAEIIDLSNTLWSGVLVIGASQQSIEMRFHDDGLVLLANDTGLPSDWVWRQTDDRIELTGHSARWSGTLRGDVMSGDYEAPQGQGSFQLFRQQAAMNGLWRAS